MIRIDNIHKKPDIITSGVRIPNTAHNELINPINDTSEQTLAIWIYCRVFGSCCQFSY